jgi:hypothetical protein
MIQSGQQHDNLSVSFTEKCYSNKSKQMLQFAKEGKKDKLDYAIASLDGSNLCLPILTRWHRSIAQTTESNHISTTSKKVLTCC